MYLKLQFVTKKYLLIDLKKTQLVTPKILVAIVITICFWLTYILVHGLFYLSKYSCAVNNCQLHFWNWTHKHMPRYNVEKTALKIKKTCLYLTIKPIKKNSEILWLIHFLEILLVVLYFVLVFEFFHFGFKINVK